MYIEIEFCDAFLRGATCGEEPGDVKLGTRLPGLPGCSANMR